MPIRRLPPQVAGKIAAGEVVERPASVVKELVENSIDSQATRIEVEIRQGGRRLIRVADNGSGIHKDQVALAFARHATSKLRTVSDLERIATLGFRGEALASIAAVSEITLFTRPKDQTVGTSIEVNGGDIAKPSSCGCPKGTIITVEHLFRNVPARLKFLRQPRTEAGHIHTVVTRYAMAYPNIQFSLTSDGRQTFHVPGQGDLREVLIAIYGIDIAEQMLMITAPDNHTDAKDTTSVYGHISPPSLHRANRSYITLFVNHRWVQDRSLTHAIDQAYHTMLPVGRHPIAIVLLTMDPSEIDVNVHPTKREIKFHDGHGVFSCVQRAVRRTLVERSPVPGTVRTPRTWPAYNKWDEHQSLPTSPTRVSVPSQTSMDIFQGSDLDHRIESIGPVRLPLLRVVGQVGQTYIIAEGPQGMYLLDQHAAHERVLYEQMMQQNSDESTVSQALLDPLSLRLDPALAGVLTESMSALNRLGFDIEPFGQGTYLLRAVPAVLTGPDTRDAFLDILEMIRQGQDILSQQAEDRIIAAVCKRAAIKAGQSLSGKEMQALVRQLEQCESPRTCPHGRPTVLHYSIERLEKEFGRR